MSSDATANMAPGWAEKLAQAQQEMTTEIGGMAMARVAYGQDYAFAVAPLCRDCMCAIGQLHVVGCVVEVCPRCRAQALTCQCRIPPALPRGRAHRRSS